MNIQELKENAQRVTSLHGEVRGLQKHNRGSYTLREYSEQFRHRLIFVDHGERDRFFWPKHVASTKLDELYVNRDEFELRFSASKIKLLSIMKEYIKGLEQGFKEHDLEESSSHRDFKTR